MARYIDADKSVDIGYLSDWYQNSIDDTKPPIWTDEHLEELTNDFIIIPKDAPTADVVEVPEIGIGNLSDGYHTFNELYHHRAILFSVICNSMPDKAWKSKLHDTGDMFENMFIVGIETPNGQATYHYDIEPYWDMFKVKELEKAPKWDGHTPADAINRIATLSADVVEVKHGHWKKSQFSGRSGFCSVRDVICSECGIYSTFLQYELRPDYYCPNCGAKMNGKGR